MSNFRIVLLTVLAAASASGQTRDPAALRAFQQQMQGVQLGPLNPPATRGLDLPGANKIDPRLRNLLTAAGAERTERSISLGAAANGRLPVIVEARTIGDVAAAEAAIRAQNGVVEADFENTIWARVPANSVTPLATLAVVDSLLVQPEERQRQEPAGSTARSAAAFGDGVRAAQMQALHQRGFTGKGVRIGILDAGFSDYSKLLREGRVKKPLAQKTFGDVPAFESGSVHGTACAEIISGAAPGAEQLLAIFDRKEGSMVQAAQWLIAQGAQIISYSMGSSMRPNDGTDTMSRFIDRTTRQNGVLWVVSAGNEGESHWMGWSDADQDGIIKIAPDLKVQGVAVASHTNHLRVIVRWDDWGSDPQKPSSNQDIDAYLLVSAGEGKGLTKVAESTDTQNGGASLPVEILEYKDAKVKGQIFWVVLKARHVTRRLKVHVFVDDEDGMEILPAIASGSISSPAAARSALAVGAVDVLTKQLAEYSSQGPTDDNRLKPDVSAPTNTVSFAYAAEEGRFPGTSSSCPHTAGFAALLKQMNPQASGLDLRTLVMQSVVGRGAPHPNSMYGYGHIDGGVVLDARAKVPDAPPQPRPQQPAPLPPSGSIVIPAEFGGSVSAATVLALRNLVNEARDGLSVRLVSGRDLYRIGDRMKLAFQASEDCSCLLFIRDSSGGFSVLTPEDSRYFRLRKGEPYFLPHLANETLEVTGPAGHEDLLLVCAGGPVNIDSAVSAKSTRGLAVATYSYVIE